MRLGRFPVLEAEDFAFTGKSGGGVLHIAFAAGVALPYILVSRRETLFRCWIGMVDGEIDAGFGNFYRIFPEDFIEGEVLHGIIIGLNFLFLTDDYPVVH